MKSVSFNCAAQATVDIMIPAYLREYRPVAIVRPLPYPARSATDTVYLLDGL